MRYKNLEVWKLSHELVMRVYALTKIFPADERYSLVDQMRRCAVSIPANIAEGSGSMHAKNYSRYLCIAYSSGCELDYYLTLSKDLGYILDSEYEQLNEKLDHIQRMLSKLAERVKR